MAEAKQESEAIWEVKGSFTDDGIIFTDQSFSKSSLQACKQMTMRAGDILIASYPKTGTSWMQEILYLIHSGADTAEASSRPIGERVPCLEHAFPGRMANVNVLSAKDGPRLMFTHLRSNYFRNQINQGQIRVILLMREPRDTMTSYYHFYRLLMKYPGSWNDYFTMIKSRRLIYGDFFDWYADWADIRDLANVLFVRFEDLKKDHCDSVKKIAKFLGKILGDEDVAKITEATRFSSMQNNPSTNQINNPAFDCSKGQFMRKGQVGDWKNYFDKEQIACFEERELRFLKPIGLVYDKAALNQARQ